MAPRYTWTDGQVLAAIEATIYAKNGQHELAELWALGRGRLAEGPGKHNVNRVMLKALAIQICKDVIERAARSGQPWKRATPPFLSKAQARDASEHLRVMQKSLGRHSPVMMRARAAQRICCNRRQAPRPSSAADAEAWLRRQLEGLGKGGGE